MLRDPTKIIESFQDNIEKSGKECKEELEKFRDLSYNLAYSFLTLVNEYTLKELMDSLMFWCYIESTEILGYTLYLLLCGLYRNASENIRHILELTVQAYYIDINHPKTSFLTKLEILKEIEDKREYHVRRLIDEKLSFRNDVCKNIDCKGFLNIAYTNLSQEIHPSHNKIIATRKEAMTPSEGLLGLVECREISRIFDSVKIVLDVFFVLFVFEHPDFLDNIRKDKDFVNCVKKYKLKLLSKVLRQSKHKKTK